MSQSLSDHLQKEDDSKQINKLLFFYARPAFRLVEAGRLHITFISLLVVYLSNLIQRAVKFTENVAYVWKRIIILKYWN